MVTPPAAPGRFERRSAQRAAAVRPVTVSRGAPAARLSHSFAVEVSAAGLLLAGPADLAVGDEVFVSVDLGRGEPPVEGKARMVRETGAGYKGMRFVRVAPGDVERLRAFDGRPTA